MAKKLKSVYVLSSTRRGSTVNLEFREECDQCGHESRTVKFTAELPDNISDQQAAKEIEKLAISIWPQI